MLLYCFSPNCTIDLITNAASVQVEVWLVVTDENTASTVSSSAASLGNMTSAALSDSLGTQVESSADVAVADDVAVGVVVAPPPPRAPPPRAPPRPSAPAAGNVNQAVTVAEGSSSEGNAAVVASIIMGVFAFVVFLCFASYVKRRWRRHEDGSSNLPEQAIHIKTSPDREGYEYPAQENKLVNTRVPRIGRSSSRVVPVNHLTSNPGPQAKYVVEEEDGYYPVPSALPLPTQAVQVDTRSLQAPQESSLPLNLSAGQELDTQSPQTTLATGGASFAQASPPARTEPGPATAPVDTGMGIEIVDSTPDGTQPHTPSLRQRSELSAGFSSSGLYFAGLERKASSSLHPQPVDTEKTVPKPVRQPPPLPLQSLLPPATLLHRPAPQPLTPSREPPPLPEAAREMKQHWGALLGSDQDESESINTCTCPDKKVSRPPSPGHPVSLKAPSIMRSKSEATLPQSAGTLPQASPRKVMASSGSVLLLPKWKAPAEPSLPSLNQPGSSSRQTQAATSRELFEAEHIWGREPTLPRSSGRVAHDGESQDGALAAAKALSRRCSAEPLRSEASQPKEPTDDERWAGGTEPAFSPTRPPP
eukprot:2649586-Prymnesium_polylepis.1